MTKLIEGFSLRDAIRELRHLVLRTSKPVHTERWQGFDIRDKPEAAMREVMFVHISAPMPQTKEELQRDAAPNLPWAEDHFLERVKGEPLNPGETWTSWPYALKADSSRDEHGQFNHNYMERYWPRLAQLTDKGKITGTKYDPNSENYVGDEALETDAMWGLRYRYGDLNDVVQQLLNEPLTRQAYLPVWFPEDTGVANPSRKPCTLGYHFIMRDGQFHVTYYIRSCDYVRHFNDDVYLTIRLAQWVLERLRALDSRWNNIPLGTFRMDIGSLHMFINDFNRLAK